MKPREDYATSTHNENLVQRTVSGAIFWKFFLLLILFSFPLATALTILSPQENMTYNGTQISVNYVAVGTTCHASTESATGGGPLLLPKLITCQNFTYTVTQGWNALILSDGQEEQSINFYVGNRPNSKESSLLFNITTATSNQSTLSQNITDTGNDNALDQTSQSVPSQSHIPASHPSFAIPNEPGRLRLATSDGRLVNAHLTWRRNEIIINDGSIDAFDPGSLPTGTYDLDVAVPGRSLQQLHLNGLRYDPALAAGIEELDPIQVAGNLPPLAIDAFAVDPSSLSFSSGSLTFIAEGNALYKCAAYNFASHTCSGPNVKLLDTIPGQEYTIGFTSDDPLYVQTGYLTNPLFATNNAGWTNLSESGTVTFTNSVADGDPAADCAQMQGAANTVTIGDYYQSFNLTIPNGTVLTQLNFSAYYRVPTYARPGFLYFWIQNSSNATYCSFNLSFGAAVAWAQVALATGNNCSLSNFALNTNYTVKLRCSLNSTAATREICRWDTINVTATYQDTSPVFNSENITPVLPHSNDTLNCSVNVTDNQSTLIPVNFTWWKNGVQNMSMNSSVMCTNATICYDNVTIGPGNLTPGALWTCNATAYPTNLTTNSSANITIQNTLPSITISSPTATVTLTAGSLTTITCNASITDPDGNATINATNATIYLNGTNATAPQNNVSHYLNTSCATTGSGATTRNISCNFTILYYASNGTWWCNVTVNDTWNLTNNATTFNISPLYALNISSTTLNFGAVPIGAISPNQSVNVSNIGNQAMNISVYGYGEVLGDNNSFDCASLNLSVGLLKFSNTITANYTQKLNLSGTPQLLNLTIPAQNNSNADLNATYWQMSIPQLFGNAGTCNGTIVFEAEAP